MTEYWLFDNTLNMDANKPMAKYSSYVSCEMYAQSIDRSVRFNSPSSRGPIGVGRHWFSQNGSRFIIYERRLS